MREKVFLLEYGKQKDIGNSIRVSIGTKEQMGFLGQLQDIRFNNLITENINYILSILFGFIFKSFPTYFTSKSFIFSINKSAFEKSHSLLIFLPLQNKQE